MVWLRCAASAGAGGAAAWHFLSDKRCRLHGSDRAGCGGHPSGSTHIVVELPAYIHEVLSALVPIILFCAVFQLIFRRFHAMQLRKIGVGFVYTFTGLSLFLTGVNVGFMPVGHYLGQQLALSGQKWVLVPLGMLIGYFLVTAEPAVHVLNRQVESITNGGISQRAMMLSLSIGVACSVGMAMLRVLTGISIYYILVPGYLPHWD